MALSVLPVDPAGNRTLLVLDPVEPARRAALSAWMLETGLGRGEQVGFVVPPRMGGWGRLEMMGGEFCGNAARSFGLWLAARKGEERVQVPVEVSGCPQPLLVDADPARCFASTQMPLPREIKTFSAPPAGKLEAVVFPGIVHVPVVGCPPGKELVSSIVRAVEQAVPSDAVGVLFLDPSAMSMKPVVYVGETGTTIWESSCGSGTVGVAVWLGRHLPDGTHHFVLHQPGGDIQAEIVRENGETIGASIGGEVRLEEVLTVELPTGL